MSFSSDVKLELNEKNNLKDKQEVYFELLGYLTSKNSQLNNTKLKFSTGNEYNINRFSKLLTNLNIVNFKISLNRKNFTITATSKAEQNIIKEYNVFQGTIEDQSKSILNNEINENKVEDMKKAFIRGCFLGGGSITNPRNTYHLEIKFGQDSYINHVIQILNEFDIKAKTLNDSVTIYIKDGEEISKFLAFIGASKSMLKFEEIRVEREMKNNVNRLVNCETANLNKTIDASVEQVSYIKKIKKAKKFHLLSEDLRELAVLREKNPNATLEELGKMLEKPIGKSSVSNRFKRIKEIADNY